MNAIFFLGKPYSGISTQIDFLTFRNGEFDGRYIPLDAKFVIHRALDGVTKVQRKVNAWMAENPSNNLPDDLAIELFGERIDEYKTKHPGLTVLLDGFPRTLPQAEALDEVLEVDTVIEFMISDETILRRARNKLFSVNKKEIIIDELKQRLEVYAKETAPLRNHYLGQMSGGRVQRFVDFNAGRNYFSLSEQIKQFADGRFERQK